MAPLPTDQWQAALDQMDAALALAARALDRAEERWERALAPSAGEGEPPPALARLDERLAAWAARLAEAAARTDGAARELDDRAAAVGRWRALFAHWEHLLQREQPSPA